jgi:pimeloyl-ACP methyl ester carboxylesterase
MKGTAMPQIRVNGIDIEYESFGCDGDPAILLIMGLAVQLIMWPAAFCEGLAARGFRVIRFDNRDIGKSTHLSHLGAPNIPETMMKVMGGQTVVPPYTLDDMAKDSVSLLDALGIKRAHIVGASMGGMIAQIVAAKYPEHTISLTSIMSTTGRRDLPQATPEAMGALMTPPASDGRADRIAQSIKTSRIIGSPAFAATDEELLASVSAAVDRVPADVAGIGRQMIAIITAPSRNDLLKGVKAPTLVIHGEADPLVPVEAGRDTAASIPGAKLITVPGMAHDFPPKLVPMYLQMVGDFIGDVQKTV